MRATGSSRPAVVSPSLSSLLLMEKVHASVFILLWTHFLTGTNRAAVNAVSLAMAARASTSSQVDGLCSTLRTSQVCHSGFPTCRSQESDPSSISSRKKFESLDDRPNLVWPTAQPCSRFDQVRYASYAFPPHPPSPRREHVFTRVAGTSSAGVVRATAVSDSGTSRTR